MKKPIYKKWWFWLLIILFIGIGAGGTSSKNDASTDPKKTNTADQNVATEKVADDKTIAPTANASTDVTADAPSETNTEVTTEPASKSFSGLSDGTYKVGTDMAPGKYLVIADSLMGYAEISSDSSGSFESIISNANILGNIYLQVQEGDYVKLQFCTAYPTSDAPSIVPSDGLYKDGVYKVGSDIPAGEYKVKLTSDIGYIEVSSGCRGTFEEIVSNDNLTGDSYVTVQDGQYLKLQGVEIQK